MFYPLSCLPPIVLLFFEKNQQNLCMNLMEVRRRHSSTEERDGCVAHTSKDNFTWGKVKSSRG